MRIIGADLTGGEGPDMAHRGARRNAKGPQISLRPLTFG
jgi:hypothetical protein